MPQWELWRQDDHGNQFLVHRYAHAVDADMACAEFESRGHHQTYWVQPPGTAEHEHAAETGPPPRVR